MIPSSAKAGSLSRVALQAAAAVPCLFTLLMSAHVIDAAPTLMMALPALLALAVFSWMRAYILILVTLLVVFWSGFWVWGNLFRLEYYAGLFLWSVLMLAVLPCALSLAVARLCVQHLRATRRAA